MLVRAVLVIVDLDDLLAECQELVRYAGAEGKLDVLCEAVGEAAFVLDVAGDALASEGDGRVVAEYLACVDGEGFIPGNGINDLLLQ